MRNLVLITLVLAVVVVIGFVVPYLRAGNLGDPSAATGRHDFTIKYTAQGFEPRAITVPVGSVVAWDNSGGRPMWVGSDPHPSHTDLEGFDQKRIINLAPFIGEAQAHGEGFYEYTFTEVGTWGYHNHAYPTDTGSVTVVEG